MRVSAQSYPGGKVGNRAVLEYKKNGEGGAADAARTSDSCRATSLAWGVFSE